MPQSVADRASGTKDATEPSKVHPHMLWHSCGFVLADKNHDLRLIQDYLGHRALRHTIHYTHTAGRRFEGLWRRAEP